MEPFSKDRREGWGGDLEHEDQLSSSAAKKLFWRISTPSFCKLGARHAMRCEETQRVQHDDDELMIMSDDRPDDCSTSGEKGKFAEIRGSICYFTQEAAERPRTVHNAGDLRPD